MLKIISLTLFLFIGFFNIAQAADIAIPKLSERVTDLTNTLSVEQKNHIEQVLIDLEKAKGSQLVVLIVPTTNPESIEGYSMRVVEKWKIGRKNIDDGVLLLVAKNDRKIRIEVGYGLEGSIPDVSAGRIINETITPNFRQNHFYEGILSGVKQLSKLILGESLPEPSTNQGLNNQSDDIGSVMFILIPGAFLSAFLRAWLGRLTTFLILALGGALVVWFLSHSLYLVIFTAIFLGIFSLGSNTSGGSSYRGGGSGGGGFSSGGGFSGGGGSFGGGGASGSW